MDPTAPFKTEVFRPITTLVIPGTTALLPYLVVLGTYDARFETLANTQPILVGLLALLAVIATGLLLEEFAAQIEAGVFDERLEARTRCHHADWHAYLKRAYAPGAEPIGHRYLRNAVLKLKFELSFGISLFICWVGLLWYRQITQRWEPTYFGFFSCGILALGLYFLYEAYQTSFLLAETRHVLLHDGELPNVAGSAEISTDRFRWVGYIDVLYSAGVATILLFWPFVKLVRAVDPAPNAEWIGPHRLLALALIGYSVLLLYVVRSVELRKIRTLSTSLALVHLSVVIFSLLPGPGTLHLPAVMNISVSGILAGAFLWVSLRRVQAPPPNMAAEPDGHARHQVS